MIRNLVVAVSLLAAGLRTALAAEPPALGVGQEQEPEEKKPPPAKWTPVQPLEPQPPQ